MSRTLDTKGLRCPLPVLKTRRSLKDLPVGETLTVQATDPASAIDFRHFCNTTAHELLESTEEEDVFTYVIRKGE